MRVKRNEECNFFSPQPEVAMACTLLEPYGMIGQPGEANYSSCCQAGVGQNPSEVRRRIDDTKRERIKRGQRDNKSSSSSRMKTQRGYRVRRERSKDAVRWQFVARLVELCCDKNRINGTDNEKMHSWPRGSGGLNRWRGLQPRHDHGQSAVGQLLVILND